MTVAAFSVVALVITKAVDAVKARLNLPPWAPILLAFALGVLAAFSVRVSFPPLEEVAVVWWAGRVLVGFALGAAASGWHEVLDAVRSYSKSKASER